MTLVDELKARFSRGLNVHTFTALIAFVLMLLEFKIVSSTDPMNPQQDMLIKQGLVDDKPDFSYETAQCYAAEKGSATLTSTAALFLLLGAHLRISWAHLPFMLLGVPCVIYEHFYDFYTNSIATRDVFDGQLHRSKQRCLPPAPAFHALCGFLGLVGIAFAIWSWNLTRLQKKDQKANPVLHLQAELGKESGHLCNCLSVRKLTVGFAVARLLSAVTYVVLAVVKGFDSFFILDFFNDRVINAAYIHVFLANKWVAFAVCPLLSIVSAVLLIVGVWKRNRWFHVPFLLFAPANFMFPVARSFDAFSTMTTENPVIAYAKLVFLFLSLLVFWFSFFVVLRSHLHFRSEAKCHELRRLLEHRLSLQSPPNPRPRLSQAEPLDVPPPPQLPL
ncbi:hypothetical protein M3Y99_00916200 [Aphelenchoides fujianensis]|nr:hypothetical protein M3Y99_00916200 [Aphelenchoides fujianensis]